jgi:hypothetical protein
MMMQGEHGDMAAMHQKHMDEAKAQLEKMKATLEKMKASVAKVKDPAAKEQDQMNVELWEAMIGHMDQMLKMMDAHPGAMGMMGMHGGMGEHKMGEHHEMDGCCGGMHHEGMGGMHHEGMAGCCADMKDGKGSCGKDGKDGCCAGMKDGMKGCCGGNKCGGDKAPAAPMDKDKPTAPPSSN